MKTLPWYAAGLALTLVSLSAAFQYQPPPAMPPDAATQKAIEARADKLYDKIMELRRAGVRDPLLPHIEIYHKAAAWTLHYGEFYNKDSADWSLAVIDRGLLRASQQARGETPWLFAPGQTVARAYRSALDGSVQPYAVTLPADYGKDPNKKWRVDVVLHGRNASLTEVSFLHSHQTEKPAPKDLNHVQIDIYGRGNNAYRWAGEMDVQEAVDSFINTERALGRGKLLDADRFVLRGFSMGGAGSWHLGLHRPDRWCVIGPGAGFTTTKGYVKNLPDKLPPYEDKCLHIYDAVDYAENVFDVPVVAYAGAEDDQLQAARNIEEKLKPLDIPMTLLIAPGLKHQFPPEWQKKAEEEYAKHVAKGRPEYPEHVHFVTYTMKYPTCFWVEILGLNQHYARSLVDAKHTEKGYTVKTDNVRGLHLALPNSATREQITVSIDGQDLTLRPYTYGGGLHVYLERQDKTWSVVLPERLATQRLRKLQKVAGLTGPIDDAFMAPFLCVRGTGKPWHEKTQEFANANLERFQSEWSKFLRGEVPVKDDEAVTADDIASSNLILFGDPSSNSLIKQVLPDLPLRWTEREIVLAGKKYAAGDHLPVLIYPSPLNAARYVVLNSGHTFHANEFEKTNALLYPRLGDFAILKPNPTKTDKLASEVIDAGLFDDSWAIKGDH
jgi:hypothetical protein